MPELSEDLNIATLEDNTIVLKGAVSRDNVLDMVERLIEKPIPYHCNLVIDVSELEIESGLTLLTLVNTFHALSKRISSLTIHGASKSLYNSIYSTGLLSGPNPIILTGSIVDTEEPA